MVFVVKVTAFGANPGAGIAARCTTPGHIADTIINLEKRRHRLAEISELNPAERYRQIRGPDGPDRNGNARPLRGVERAEGQLRFRRSAQTLGPPGRDRRSYSFYRLRQSFIH